MYANGVKVKKDCRQAVKMYQRASFHPQAQAALGDLYLNCLGDNFDAYDWYWFLVHYGNAGNELDDKKLGEIKAILGNLETKMTKKEIEKAKNQAIARYTHSRK
jgi:TPR repeat protein